MQVKIFLGSESDKPHAEKIENLLADLDINSEVIVASAHKVPEKVVEKVEELNKSDISTVIITCVGMSNGLSGVVAGSSVHPVIACPVFKDSEEFMININSTLQMPSEVPVMTVLHPKNAALAAAKILGENNADLRGKLAERIKEVKGRY
jgi:5-(carboxyamino)imidazole ribonucleotide mutase